MQYIPQIPLQPVDTVTISILADNLFDGLLPDQGLAKRPMLGPDTPRVSAPLMEGGQAFASILAQHGFSALVKLTQNGREHSVLFDTGATPDGLIENMRLFGRSPKDIETVVLSHGHSDHTTGLDGLVRALGRANLPLLIHPESGIVAASSSQAETRSSFPPPANPRCKGWGLRSWRSASLRSYSTAHYW